MSKLKTAKTIAKQIQQDYEQHREQLEASMKETTPGTRAHLDHINALANLDRKHRDELAERGLIPQQLGAAVTRVYEFTAVVTPGEFKQSAADKLYRQALDDEFGDHPTAYSPDSTKTKGKE